MKHDKIVRNTLIATPLVLLAAALAWAGTEQVATEVTDAAKQSTTEVAGSTASEMATDAADLAETSAEEPVGLDIVMDGSSLETFKASMEKVRETGGEKAYLQLQDAFDYLLLYDVGARGKPEILAARLNGMTGKQVTELVNYGRKSK